MNMTGCTTLRPLSPGGGGGGTDHVLIVLEWAIPRAVLDVVTKIKRILRQNLQILLSYWKTYSTHFFCTVNSFTKLNHASIKLETILTSGCKVCGCFPSQQRRYNWELISLERESTQAVFPNNLANTFVWVVPIQKFALRRRCEFHCHNEYHVSWKLFNCFRNSDGEDRQQSHPMTVML